MSENTISENKTIHFFHVDDELLRVAWIPEALYTYYYQQHRQHFRNADEIEEKHKPYYSASFKLLGEDEPTLLNYAFFENGNLLLEQSDRDLKTSIIILDLMALTDKTAGQAPVGANTLEKLLKKGIDKNRIYTLTAYESGAKAQMKILDDKHILTKPIDATTLAPILLNAAGIKL